MVLFNYSTKEITAKVVYYGPGLCGKTTNLQTIYDNMPKNIQRGRMLSLATKTDRTLFFDFLPLDLGTIRDMKTRVQLYTVPGQVFYNSTRKLVLKGADGLVFVADSQKKMKEANLESFRNLEENCIENGIDLAETPLVLQFNKRDLPDLMSPEELSDLLNKYNSPFYESVATTGIGVHETLKGITKLVIHTLQQRHLGDRGAEARNRRAAGKPAAISTPTPVPSPEPIAEVVVEPPAALVADQAVEPPSPEAPAVESIPLAPPSDLGRAPKAANAEAPAPAASENPFENPFEEPTVEMPFAEESPETAAAEAPVIAGLLLRAPMGPPVSEETETFADLTAEFDGQEPFLPTSATPERPEAALPEPPVLAAGVSPVTLEEDDPLGLGQTTAPTAAAVLPTSLPLVLKPGQEEVHIPLEVRSGDRVERFKLRLHISLGRDD